MEFKSAFDPVVVVDSVPAAAYNHLQDTYSLDTGLGVEGGTLKVTGKRDVYAEIQAASPGTVLSEAVQKFGVSKFIEKAEQLPPESFGDATLLPTSIMDAMETMNRANKAWNDLPPEVRRAFGNDMYAFVQAYDNGTLSEKIQPKEEVKSDAES